MPKPPSAPQSWANPIVLRVLVGGIFLSEGLQKFLFAAERGAGRFARIGLPRPELLGPFVGGVEVVCGVLLILGLFTRYAAVPPAIIMLVALWTTKLPVLLESGFWQAIHDSRTDLAMLACSILLISGGGGPWSVDARRGR